MRMPALAFLILTGLCSQASAQGACPELSRLRSEAAKAPRQTVGVVTADRCGAYIRQSMAWDALVDYANDNRDMCGVSQSSLSDYERYRREAATARDNVCAGRPARPFPPDIILR
jgi:hypothetical protein